MTIQIASSLPAALRRPSLGSLFVALALTACGGGGGGSDATNTQPEPSPPPVVTNPTPDPLPPPVVTNPQPDLPSPPVASKGSVSLLAGSLGGPGNLDAVGTAARFNYPAGLAIGPNGDLYVADSFNQRIRKITPAGVVSTIAGSGELGEADGPARQAAFCYPEKIAVGPDASVFVTERATVRKIDPSGNVRTVTGPTAVGCRFIKDSDRIAPRFPSAIAVDALGIAYIGDSFAGAIYTLTPAGALTLFAGSEVRVGFLPDLNAGRGIALDAARNVYVIGGNVPDLSSNTVVRISQSGEITTVVPASREIAASRGMTRDAAGNLYFIEGSGNSVVRKITPDGRTSIIAGVADSSYRGGSVDGPLGTGRLTELQGIAAAADGTVYVSERSNTIRRIDPATGNLSTFAGRAPRSPSLGQHATNRAGNVFFVDHKPYPQEPGIGRIAPDGMVTTLVGGGLKRPSDIAMDGAGNLYVLDSNGTSIPMGEEITTAFVVRKITPQGEMSVFAGSLDDTSVFPPVDVDGVGTAARLNNAHAVTTDPAGNVVVAQYLGAPLRKITPQGVVSTVAVTLPGTRQFPNAVAADGAGNTYLVSCERVTDGNPNQANAAILKVDPNQNVSVLAGSLIETGYVDGPGAQARFAAERGLYTGLSFSAGTCPSALALDATNNLFVADTGNDTVRKITTDGVVSTAVGQQGVRGVAPGPLPASLALPFDVSFDAAGQLYVGSEGSVLKVQLSK